MTSSEDRSKTKLLLTIYKIIPPSKILTIQGQTKLLPLTPKYIDIPK